MESARIGFIYTIRHFEKILYVSQTVNPDKRIDSHKRKLYRGDHKLESLQHLFIVLRIHKEYILLKILD